MTTGTPIPASPAPAPRRDPAPAPTSGAPTSDASSVGQSQEAQGGPTTTPADPFEALLQALEAGDGAAAWSTWITLPPADQSQLSAPQIQRLAALVYPVQGLAAAQEIFATYEIGAAGQLRLMSEAGLLDDPLVFELVNTPGVTADEQATIAQDPALMTAILAVSPAYLPHELFLALAADPARFVQACAVAGPLADWVGQDEATLKAVTDAIPEYAEWTKTFQAHGAWDRLLTLCEADEASRLAWRGGIVAGSGFGWLLDAAPHPITDEALAQALIHLYADGSDFALEDKYKVWGCLYNARLVHSAEDLETWRSNPYDRDGWQETAIQYYHGVAPNDAAMNLFFQQFTQIPRVQINLASTVIMTDHRVIKIERYKPASHFLFWEVNPEQRDVVYRDAANVRHATRAPAEERLVTSYYNSAKNVLLMQATTAAGTPSTTTVPDRGVAGAGRSPSAVNRQTNPDGTLDHMLTYFENHATHEIGHAVGCKRLVKDGIDAKGDDYAKSYASWQQGGSALLFARQMGWTAANDSASWRLNLGAVTAQVPGDEVRDFLVAKVSKGTVAATNGVQANFGNNGLNAILNTAALTSHALVTFVNRVGSADGCYNFYEGVPAPQGGKVYFFSTRWEDKWVNYNKSAWDERVSHYSVSSYKEMFAEIYTAHYTGNTAPAGMQPFFTALDSAVATDFPDVATPAAPEGSGASESPPEDTPWP